MKASHGMAKRWVLGLSFGLVLMGMLVGSMGYELVDEYYAEDDDEGWDDPYEQFDPIPDDGGNEEAVIDPEPASGEEEQTYEAVDSPDALFLETFQGPWSSRWMHSEDEKYNGKFSVGGGGDPSIHGDKGLIVTKKAKFYGLSTLTSIPDPSESTLVIQFEAKAEAGIICSGAYIKLLAEPFSDLTGFNGSTPFSFMFGPDKCGENDFTRFIYQTKNPITGKYTEHQLSEMPGSFLGFDKKTHLYTLILKGSSTTGNSFEILIDQKSERKGSLWSADEFRPPRRMPKKTVDPNEKKPDDWAEEKFIADPEDKKPSNWEEDVRGEWKAKMIKNPNYKGVWKPRKIDNPEFYEVESIGLLKSTGIGIDIWAMDHSIMFDNIIVTNDEKVASEYADKTWKVKRGIENEKFRKEIDIQFQNRAKSRTLELEEEPEEKEDEYEYVYVYENEESGGKEGPPAAGPAAGNRQPYGGAQRPYGRRGGYGNFYGGSGGSQNQGGGGGQNRGGQWAADPDRTFLEEIESLPTSTKVFLLSSVLLFLASLLTFARSISISKGRSEKARRIKAAGKDN